MRVIQPFNIGEFRLGEYAATVKFVEDNMLTLYIPETLIKCSAVRMEPSMLMTMFLLNNPMIHRDRQVMYMIHLLHRLFNHPIKSILEPYERSFELFKNHRTVFLVTKHNVYDMSNGRPKLCTDDINPLPYGAVPIANTAINQYRLPLHVLDEIVTPMKTIE